MFQLDLPFALLALSVFLAFSASSVTGFGSTVITLAIAGHFYALELLPPVVIPLSLVLSALLVGREPQAVDWSLLLRRILPWMGLGTAGGVVLQRSLHGQIFHQIYGLLVVLVAGIELTRQLRTSPPATSSVSRALLIASGVMHGLYASGGPLLVYGLGRTSMSPAALRTTQSMVWIALNTALTVAFLIDGRMNATSLRASALLLPVVGLAILSGGRLYRRLDGRAFRVALYALLMVCGAGMML